MQKKGNKMQNKRKKYWRYWEIFDTMEYKCKYVTNILKHEKVM